jgi:diacylglycerol kinase family enzyme
VLPYLVAGVSIAREFRGVDSTVVIDDRTVRTTMLLVVVSNIQLYGGVVKMTPEARLDDGLLDVRIFRGMGRSWVFRHVAGVFTHRHLRNPMVWHYQGRHIVIDTTVPVPVQLDGEPVGETPIAIEVVPRSLRVLVPRAAPAELFSRSADGRPVLPSRPPRRRLQALYNLGLRVRGAVGTNRRWRM